MNMTRFVLHFLVALAMTASVAYAQTPQSYNTVASIAALKAMTNRPQVVQVTGTNAGIFNLNAGACSAADDLTQVQPTFGITVCYVRAANVNQIGKSGTGNGVLSTDGTGYPSISTALPNGLNIGTPSAGNVSALSVASGPAAGLLALSVRFQNPVDVRSYGAACDGVTDDHVAFNDALFNNSWVTIPAGKTCAVSGSISIGNTGRRLSGAGPGVSAIKNLTDSASAVIVAAGLSYVSIDGLSITHNTTATNGAGIGFAGNCGVCNLSNLIVEKHYVGISALSTEQAYMTAVTVQENVTNGLLLQNTASSGIVQWIVDGLLAQKNGGTGILVMNGPAGPAGMILGSWNRIYTFANSGYGFAAVGSGSMPINGVRISDSFLGADGNSEIFLSTYGGLHTIYNTFLELTGIDPTGPTMSTPASGVGHGIEIDANNSSVQISSIRVNGVSQDSVRTAATAATTIANLQASFSGGAGMTAADCSKVQIAGAYFASNTGGNVSCTTNGDALNASSVFPTSLNRFIGADIVAIIPTSCSGQPTGAFWNDSGTVKVCP